MGHCQRPKLNLPNISQLNVGNIVFVFIKVIMLNEGVEPTILAELDPKSSVSASFTN